MSVQVLGFKIPKLGWTFRKNGHYWQSNTLIDLVSSLVFFFNTCAEIKDLKNHHILVLNYPRYMIYALINGTLVFLIIVLTKVTYDISKDDFFPFYWKQQPSWNPFFMSLKSQLGHPNRCIIVKINISNHVVLCCITVLNDEQL